MKSLISTAIKHHQIAKRKAGSEPVHKWAQRNITNKDQPTQQQARMVDALHRLHEDDEANEPAAVMQSQAEKAEGEQ